MEETSPNIFKKYIKVVYLASLATLLYLLILVGQPGVDPIWISLIEWAWMIPVLLVPLLINISLLKRVGLFLVLAFTLTWFGTISIGYTLYGMLFSLALYDLGILLAIIISHFIMKKLLSLHSAGQVVLGLAVIFIIIVTFLSIQIYNIELETEKHTIYNRIRSSGNSISVEQFEKECEKLTGEFWEYYRDLCFANLESRKDTGRMCESFARGNASGKGDCYVGGKYWKLDPTR